jgi:hypothetical protein
MTISWAACAVAILLVHNLLGCASFGEGLGRGLAEGGKSEGPRLCEVTGPAFEGVEARLQRHERRPSSGEGRIPNVKVLMVHGIGTHPPGWSTRLQRNLSAALGLTVVSGQAKHIHLRPYHDKFKGVPLGTLTVVRYTNESRSRELLAYELSWSEITDPKKKTIAYDTSGEQQYKRAAVNHTIKVYLNDRLADPMAYLGDSGEKILEAAGEALCWMASGDWNDLPNNETGACEILQLQPDRLEDFSKDEIVFITHSLGSRIVSDTLQILIDDAKLVLQEMTKTAEEREIGKQILETLQNKNFRVYMLANQLPLLDLARKRPEIVGQIDAYCRPEGSKYDERALNQVFIVAFSDPNDPLSYSIPAGYEEERMDSRLCPQLVNVSVGVTEVIDLFGIGEIAHPVKAHELYDDDERVIGIIAAGIGNEQVKDVVKSECTWLRVSDD